MRIGEVCNPSVSFRSEFFLMYLRFYWAQVQDLKMTDCYLRPAPHCRFEGELINLTQQYRCSVMAPSLKPKPEKIRLVWSMLRGTHWLRFLLQYSTLKTSTIAVGKLHNNVATQHAGEVCRVEAVQRPNLSSSVRPVASFPSTWVNRRTRTRRGWKATPGVASVESTPADLLHQLIYTSAATSAR